MAASSGTNNAGPKNYSRQAKAFQFLTFNQERLWNRVEKSGTCWNWTGPLNRCGYGWLRSNGTPILAHRAAYLLGTGYLFLPMYVCHHCDNPKCCNPDHLFSGWQSDNMRDMAEKGRRKGIGMAEQNGRAKLKWSDIDQIKKARSLGDTIRKIAIAHNVGETTIARVLNGENWNESQRNDC